MIDDKLKREQVEVRAGILDLLADEEDNFENLRQAYANLPREAWLNQVAQNVVKSEGYDRLDPVEAASQLALTTEVAELIKERLHRRFDMVVCASTSIFPYVDTVGEYKAITCETHTLNVPHRSAEAIADTLAALIRLTAQDEDDTLFIYRLIRPIRFTIVASADEGRPRYQTSFACVRRKVP